jgi:haloalkane dehalogenase
LRKFNKPFLTAFSDSDPVSAGGDRYFQREIPGCDGQPHTTVANAAHFLQEDAGEKFADVVNQFIR